MRPVVLLSTYNGSRFIEEQVTSILTQLPRSGQLLIRDDGSTDGTPEVIERMDDSRIQLIRGANLGFARSFFTLMESAPDNGNIYLFSDQDDIWLPGKIERTWAALQPDIDKVSLYCGRAQLVDRYLTPIGITPDFSGDRGFRQALTENIATGCTIGITRRLLDIAPPARHVSHVHFHDWWLYVLASAFGTVHYDPVPTLLYRQHGQNVIGMGSGVSRYLTVLAHLRRQSWLRTMNQQIGALRANHAARLTQEQIRIIDSLQAGDGSLRRARIVFSPRNHRANLLNEILFRGMTAIDLRNASAHITELGDMRATAH